MNAEPRDLRLNVQGADVSSLHQQLIRHGYAIDAAERAMSIFGATTRQHVMDLQDQLGLQVTGVVDNATAQAFEHATELSETAAASTVRVESPGVAVANLVTASPVAEEPRRLEAPMSVAPGAVGAAIEVDVDEFTGLLRRAFASERELGRSVVWQMLDSELAVDVPRIRVALLEGLVIVGIPVRCDQAMDGVELVVPLAVGTPDDPAGLVVTAETSARGNSELVVAVWGETAVAATWLAFIEVCRQVAARAGEDDCCRSLLPGAVWANPNTLGVVPQAEHAIDRAALR